jgi:pyruvate,water dikinase
MYTIPLASCEFRWEAGNKARRLAAAQNSGENVPPSIVVLPALVEAPFSVQIDTIANVLEEVGSGLVAVRSSSPFEDSNLHSFAGLYPSLLNVSAHVKRVFEACESVWHANESPAVKTYARHNRITLSKRPAAIVQAMVKPTLSGVLISSVESQGSTGTLIEVGPGAAAVVGGETPLYSILLDAGGNVLFERGRRVLPRARQRELLALGRRCEAIMNTVADVEWALESDDLLVLLQLRPVTQPVKL